ncbi:glutamate--tRNA ligase [Candidatus Peregrinibacteria bacterium]|nr:glutamate--tRNA ligase [Candidatus Peregrinibacteria bacterium]
MRIYEIHHCIVRTRFPPSPTGFLHIGGLRTALYCYLIAKQTKDSFILRIEDTDRERTVPGALENIVETLYWAGITPDEGVVLQNSMVGQHGPHGPYIQSERLEIYRKHAQILLDTHCAYYAFDTKDDLEAMRTRETAAGNPAPKYDASVRMRMKNSLTMTKEETKAKLDAGEPYVIRMKIPEGNVVRFTDDIRGNVEFKGMEIDDQILMKSDGFPTYHLANVVDDHLMQVDLVIRGEEWLSSTPKHLLLFEYFGWPAPRYAHVPLLLNQDRSKLSKRQNDVSVQDYIDRGYLPEAILNFIALLGWNPGTTQELFTMKELIEQFSLERVQKGGAVFDREKLDWFQGQWIRKIAPKEFADRIRPLVAGKYPEAENDPKFHDRAALIQERITFFSEAPEMLSYYYVDPAITKDLLANKKQKVTEELLPQILAMLETELTKIAEKDWNPAHLEKILRGATDSLGLKIGQTLWPLRAALTGLPFSPGAFEVAAALGKAKTLKRVEKAKQVK